MSDVACVKSGRRRGWLALAGALVLALGITSPADAARKKQRAPAYSPPYAAIVIDAKTGRVMHAANADALRHPASITKVMTLYLLFEQMERGRYSMNSPLRVSARAASRPPSKLGLTPGESITVHDAIMALITRSANDVASVIAENIAGDEDSFAEQMTRRARQLGMSRTIFRNASGLPNPAQVTTARDLTILARALQERFPRYYSLFQTRSFEYAGRVHRTTNKLLGRVEGVDGIKTGYTRASGFNLMTSARANGRHVITVVLGGKSGRARDTIVSNLVLAHLPNASTGAARTLVAQAPDEAPPRPAPRPAAIAAAQPAPVPPPASRAPAQALALAPLPVARPDSLRDLIVASEPQVQRAALSGRPVPPRQLDLALARPVAAQAAAAPLPPMRALPPAVQQAASPVPRPPANVDTTSSVAKVAAAAAAPAAAAPAGWQIQLGATNDEAGARTLLDKARSVSRALASVKPFTEPVQRDGSTLFRARFAGFEQAAQAANACRDLKRNGFDCFAVRG